VAGGQGYVWDSNPWAALVSGRPQASGTCVDDVELGLNVLNIALPQWRGGEMHIPDALWGATVPPSPFVTTLTTLRSSSCDTTAIHAKHPHWPMRCVRDHFAQIGWHLTQPMPPLRAPAANSIASLLLLAATSLIHQRSTPPQVSISRIRVDFETAYSTDVHVSGRGRADQPWVSLTMTSLTSRQISDKHRVTEFAVESTSTRFVRLSGLTPSTSWGTSVWELQVYGIGRPVC